MPTTTYKRRRILFVDDDPQFLDVTRELMGAFSGGLWEISTAESASRAFALLQDQPVDLAVIDVQMGVMDGIQMLSLLNRGYPNVQKVVLTGFANENFRAACLSNGAELFLEKPTTQQGWQSLFRELNELVKFKPEEGFRGVLRRVDIHDMLQMECLSGSSSVLEISDAQTQGRIFVEHGQIIHAQCGDRSAEDAFNQLVSLNGGQFNLKPFTEPPARTISGSWEFLLMGAARKRNEAMEEARLIESSAAATSDELVIIDAETGEPMPGEPVAESATDFYLSPGVSPSAAAAYRPKVEEMLICSAQGEVLHEWQCRNVDLWVNFFEFISKRAQRLAQALPLGEFDRLEIQNADSRAVVIISDKSGVMVKTRKVPVEKQAT